MPRRRSFAPQLVTLESRITPYAVNDPGDLGLDPDLGAAAAGKTENGTITLRSASQQVEADGGGEVTFQFPMTITTTNLFFGKNATITGLAGTAGPRVTVRGELSMGEGSTISDVTIDAAGGRSGTALTVLPRTTISGVHIRNAEQHGIYSIFGPLVDVTVTGSTISGCKKGGITLGAWVGVTVADSTIRDNGEYAMRLGKNATVSGCEITGNGRLLPAGTANDAVVVGNFSQVRDNFIGVRKNGSAAGNRGVGLSFEDDCTVTGNVVSGNAVGGIGAGIAGHNRNTLTGNFVGTNKAGTAAVPNAGYGVNLFGNGNTLRGNTVAGNGGIGVIIDGANNKLFSNRIGAGTGGQKLGNGTADNPSPGVSVSGSRNTIGDGNAANKNTIAFNTEDGVSVGGATGTTIRANAIFGNKGLGIDHNGDARFAPNDTGKYAAGGWTAGGYAEVPDADTGPNGRQNYPAFGRVAADGTVYWTLVSTPGKSYTVDFYSNDPDEAAGDFGQGEQYQFSLPVALDADGRAEFAVPKLKGRVGAFTATATRTDTADTSEFSPADTDGDGLADEWEVKGVDYDGDGTVDLRLPGARKDHKDLYVELNAAATMAPVPLPAGSAPLIPAGVTPTGTVLDLVVGAFASAPAALVRNPDNAAGVRLHLRPNNMGEADIHLPAGYADLYAQRRRLFASDLPDDNAKAAVRLAYRFCLFANTHSGGASSGLSEVYGNDFCVTLGDAGWQAPSRPAAYRGWDQAGTFMHEFGHALGLTHGGGGVVPGSAEVYSPDPDRAISFKPNYYSLMNYTWQTKYARARALSAGEQDFVDSWRLDYSRDKFITLNETALSEAVPLAPAGASFPTARPTVLLGVFATAADGGIAFGPLRGVSYLVSAPGPRYLGPQFVRMDQPVNWDTLPGTTAAVHRVLADRNGDDLIGQPGGTPNGTDAMGNPIIIPEDRAGELKAYDPDWTLLQFGFRQSAQFADESSVEGLGVEADGGGELTAEMLAAAAEAKTDLAVTAAAGPARVGQNLTFTLTVTNRGADAAADVTVSDALPAGVAFVSAAAGQGFFEAEPGRVTFRLGELAAGAAATLTVVVRPAAAGAVRYTAGVRAAATDTNPANDTAALTVTVLPASPPVVPPVVPPTVPPVVPPTVPPTAGPKPVLVGYPQFAVGADAGGGTATLYNPDRTVRATLTPFGDFTGGVRAAAGDFNRDGVADLVVGTGPGRATRVVVLDGVTQKELFAVDPFESTFTGGVYVAAGDVTGDGVPELVVTPDEGGGPRCRVFDGANGFSVLADFFGIDDPDFRGGARAAVGDVDGDGAGDLVVAAGFQGGPRVAGFSGRTLASGSPARVFPDFFAFEQTLRNGTFVAAGDVDGDGRAEVIAGGGPGGGPRVTAFSVVDLVGGAFTPVANFFGGDPDSRGGIRVAVKNLDADNRADLVVGAGAGAGGRVTGYLGKNIAPSGTPATQFDFDALPGFAGGVFVG